jgi:hypothetical protein
MLRHNQPFERRNLLCRCIGQPAIFFTIALVCLFTLTQASFAGNAVIISFDPPGSIATYVTGINAAATVVGYFQDTQGFHGFSRNSAGQISIIDAAGSTSQTQIYSINDSGEMAGVYYSGSYQGFTLDRFGNLTSFNIDGLAPFPTGINSLGVIAGVLEGGTDGYTRDASGNITTFFPPNAISMGVPHIDAFGRVTGNYTDASIIIHGYMRDQSGNFTNFNAPDAGTDSGRGTFVTGMTTQGITIAGYSTDQGAVAHGFIRQESGKFTVFDVPGAGTFAGTGTFPTSINLSGATTGRYEDSSYVSHGFVRDQLGNITAFDDAHAGHGYQQGTFPAAINGSGQIAGIYTNSQNGAGHGFLRITNRTRVATFFFVGGRPIPLGGGLVRRSMHQYDFHSYLVTSDLAPHFESAHDNRGGSSTRACTMRALTPLRSRF